ncbi:hypothetical protein [Salinarimonas sp.]|uniref:hypothetical protein n=1 Tax=Salinarimonas sp. TaxID=2766526 RepID=UPI0032D97F69
MTNKDMVKSVDPKKAKAPDADRAKEHHEETTPRTDLAGEQFPEKRDPEDSPQLKPMINARKKPGLRRE